MINIAIAEDNPLSLKDLEERLGNYPEIHLTHKAVNGRELLDLLQQNQAVDLILMDIQMPEMDGIEATQKIKSVWPGIKIVMITVYDDDNHIFEAIKAGADGYILKDTPGKKVYETILDTLNGGSVMSPSIAQKTLRLLKLATLPESIPSESIALSDRETEILELLSKGHPNKVIAAKLYISPFTVKRHIENIYQKLQTHNRIELVEKARKSGLIS
jgi:DNA-binding NarL/FixJ family response regulator